MLIRFLISITILLSLSACATYRAKFASPNAAFKSTSHTKPVHTVYLIGDAGVSPSDQASKALQALHSSLRTESEKSTVIFLGDNIYPNGLVDESDPDHENAKYYLQSQIDAVDNFEGRSYMIPGNHDWRSGLKGLKRQEKYVENAIDQKDVFLPENGCSGPELVELNDRLSLVVIDSEWWLQDWNKDPDFNKQCDIKTRQDFLTAYSDILKKNRSKDLLVAMHHPLYTYGVHGGNFGAKDHFFPLTDLSDGLYVPMPVLGSIYPFLRGNIGIKQDNLYKPFLDFRNAIVGASKEYDNIIFAAGHEHNMQYIIQEELPFIVSGAGAKRDEVKLGPGALFAIGEYGFAQLDYFEDESVVLSFYKTPDGKKELVYRTEVKKSNRFVIEQVAESNITDATVEKSIYDPEKLEKSKFFEWTWGQMYRQAYGYKVEVPVVKLDTLKGGLEPVRKGGGFQTRSLRLENENGEQYVMRGMNKDVARLIGDDFTSPFLEGLLKDFYTSAHPYAAFAVPPMADAVGVFHTNPEMVYLPRQKALNQYSADFGDALYLFEERPSGDRSEMSNFGNSKKIISSFDLMDRMRKDDKHKVDQRQLIRSRLFDITIGDWDRHEDQWRWASYDLGDTILYKPIPRDRDQAFASFEGWLTLAATRTVLTLRRMQKLDGNTERIKWLTMNTRAFDRKFLKEVEWPLWKSEINHIQENLTDDVIENAFNEWPEVVRNNDAPNIISIVKQRRDNLEDMALRYFEFLTKNIDIEATDKNDYIEINRSDRALDVGVYTNKSKEKTIFYRSFDPNLTKEIQLYGLDGDDEFVLYGDAKKVPKIRLIGGRGEDAFIENGDGNKRAKIYDQLHEDNTLSGKLSDKRSNQYYRNQYIFKDIKYSYTSILPFLSYSLGDGVFAGGTMAIQIPGFKKETFAHEHSIVALASLATGGLYLRWRGTFHEVLGNFDLRTELLNQSPRFASNFFDWGNETSFDEEINFYRIREQIQKAGVGLQKQYKTGIEWELHTGYQSVEVERTENRLIAELLEEGVEERESEFLTFSYELRQQNHRAVFFPTQGINFRLRYDYFVGLGSDDPSPNNFSGSLTLYKALNRNRTIVYATQVGGALASDDMPFFLANTLGGGRVRGFVTDRLTGQGMLFHNNDVRFKLGNVDNRVIPFTLGISASADYGRVYYEDEDSDRWHSSFGGALWFGLFDAVTLRFGAHSGTDGLRILLGFGFAY